MKYYCILDLLLLFQSDSIAYTVERTAYIGAAFSIIDLIAIADGKAVLGAVPPDRALHEPRKRRRKGWIELPRIDVGCEEMENRSAPSRPVAPVPVWMISADPVQDPGSMQEIMDEGVDGYEGRPDFDP